MSIQYTSTYLLDAIHINVPGLDSPSSTPRYFFGTKNKLSFIEGLEYTLKINVFGIRSDTSYEARMDVYVVGDAFPNYDSYGTSLATYTLAVGVDQSEFLNQEINFKAIKTGTAHLRFVVYSGDWHISNVGIFSARETGFNPDEVNVSFPVIGKRYEQLEFKVELFDNNNNSVPVKIETDPIYFDGGNTVVRGMDNRLHGRLTLTPSGSGPILGGDGKGTYIGIGDVTQTFPRPLAPGVATTYTGPPIIVMYSGSAPYSASSVGPAVGFQVVGYNSLSGSTSFIDFNTQTGNLTIMGDLYFLPGTPTSKSISLLMSGSSGSGADALLRLDRLVNGQSGVDYPAATFIRSDVIYSPNIAGRFGYISQMFGVGPIAGGKGIVLSSEGFLSGGAHQYDAPAIWIGGATGAFADAGTPFLVASGSRGPVLSLGDKFWIQIVDGQVALQASGTLGVLYDTGSGIKWTDVRNVITHVTMSLSSSFSAYNLAYSASAAAKLSASMAAQSASTAQLSASFLDFTASIFWPFSASQAANNALQSASIYAQSASIAQLSASFLDFTSSVFWPYSASQAQNNAIQSASILAQSASLAQLSASFIDMTSSQAFIDFSASQVLNNATQSAQISALAATDAQISASFLDFTSSVFWPFSASQALNNATQSAQLSSLAATDAQISSSFLDFTSSVFWPFSASQALNNATQSAQIAAQSASTAQLSASFLNFTSSVWSFSASQALLNATQSANNTAQSASIAQLSASFIDFTGSQAFYDFSASQAANNAMQSASIYAQSASIAQLSASFLDFTGSQDFQFFSASQATNNAMQSASIYAQSASIAQLSASFLIFTGSVWSFSASQASNNAIQTASITAQSGSTALLSASFLNFTASVFWPLSQSQAIINNNLALSQSSNSSSLAQRIEFRAVTDAANRIKLPTSQKTGSFAVSGGLFLERQYMGFWQPFPSGGVYLSGNLAWNYPVVFNSDGQFRIAHSQSWDFSQGIFTESIAFANESLAVRTSRLLVGTPGLTMASTKSSAAEDQVLNYLKLGGAGASNTLTSDVSDNLTGSYLDGTGTFRFGYNASNIRFNPTIGALFISTSYFNLKSNYNGNEVGLDPFAFYIGNPAPYTTPIYPNSKVGFVVSNTGEFWLGSGSIDAGQALAGNGNYLYFNPNLGGYGVLQIRSDTLFVSTSNASIVASGSGGLTNVIRLWGGAIPVTSDAISDGATGSYIDGTGAFRFGYKNNYIQGGSTYGLLISASYFNLLGGSTLEINPSYISLGAPRPTSIPIGPNSRIGFIVANTGDFWLGSGSLSSTQALGGTGSYIHYSPNLYGKSVLQIKTDALYISSSNATLQLTGSGVTNVFKLWKGTVGIGADAQSDTGTGSYIDGAGAFRFGYKDNMIQGGNTYGFLISSSYFNLYAGGTLQINPTYISVGSSAALRPTGIPIGPNSRVGFIVSNTGDLWVGSGSIDSGRALAGTGSYLHFNASNGIIQLKTNALFVSSSNTAIIASGSSGVTNVFKMWNGSTSLTADAQSDTATGSYIDGTGAFRFGYKNNMIQGTPAYGFFVSSSYFNLKSGNTLEINPYFISIGSPSRPTSIPMDGNSVKGFIVSSQGDVWIGSGSISSTRALDGTGSYFHFNPNIGVIQLRTAAMFISTSNSTILTSGSSGTTNVVKLWSGSISIGQSALNDLGTGSYIDGDGYFRFGYRDSFVQGGSSYGVLISSSYFNLNAGGTLEINPDYISIGSPRPTGIPLEPNSVKGFIVSKTGETWIGSGSVNPSQALAGIGSYLHFRPDIGVIQLKTDALFVSSSNTTLLASGGGGITNVIKLWSGSTSVGRDALSDIATGSYIDGDGYFRFGYRDSFVQGGTSYGVLISSSYFNLNSTDPSDGSSIQLNNTFFAIGKPRPDGTIPVGPNSKIGFIVSDAGELWVGSGSISSTQALSGTGSYLHFNPNLGGRGVLQLRTDALFVSTSNATIIASGSGVTNVVKLWKGTTPVTADAISDQATGSYIDGTGAFRFGYARNMIQGGNTYGFFISSSYFNLNAGGTLQINPTYIALGQQIPTGIPFGPNSKIGFIVSNTGDFWVGSGSIASNQALSGTGSYIHFTPSLGGGKSVLQIKTDALFISSSNTTLIASGTSGATNVLKMWSGSVPLTLNAIGAGADTATGSYIDGNGYFRFGYQQNVIQGGPSYGLMISSSYFNLLGGSSLEINPYYISLGLPRPTTIPSDGASRIGFYVAQNGALWLGSGSIASGQALGGTGSYVYFSPAAAGGTLSIRTQAFFVSTSNALIQAVGSGATNVIKMWSGANQVTADAMSDTGTGSYIDGAGTFRFGYKNNMIQGGSSYGFFISSSYFNLNAGGTLQINPTYIALGSPIPTPPYPIGPNSAKGFIVSNQGDFWVGSGSIDSGRALAGTGSYIHFNPSLGGRGVLQIKTDALFISTSNTALIASGTSGVTNVFKMWNGSTSLTADAQSDTATGSYIDGTGAFRFGYKNNMIQGGTTYGFLVSSSWFNLKAGTGVLGSNTLELNPYFISIGNPLPTDIPSSPTAPRIGFVVSNTGELWIGSGSIDPGRAGGGVGSYIHFNPSLGTGHGGKGVVQIKTDALFISTSNASLIASGTGGTTNVLRFVNGSVGAGNLTFAPWTDNITGSYIDGSGNFRIGHRNAHVVFSVTSPSGLFISTSYFDLKSNTGATELDINPYYMSLGSPRPIDAHPASKKGFYADTSGSLFIGSGSAPLTTDTSQYVGSWIAFDPSWNNGLRMFLQSASIIIPSKFFLDTFSPTASMEVGNYTGGGRGVVMTADGFFAAGNSGSGQYIELRQNRFLFNNVSIAGAMLQDITASNAAWATDTFIAGPGGVPIQGVNANNIRAFTSLTVRGTDGANFADRSKVSDETPKFIIYSGSGGSTILEAGQHTRVGGSSTIEGGGGGLTDDSTGSYAPAGGLMGNSAPSGQTSYIVWTEATDTYYVSGSKLIMGNAISLEGTAKIREYYDVNPEYWVDVTVYATATWTSNSSTTGQTQIENTGIAVFGRGTYTYDWQTSFNVPTKPNADNNDWLVVKIETKYEAITGPAV